MKAKPIISVVIPIFNVEDYLAECLDSVLGQTLDNIEVILVNDGSTDSSLDIIRDYEARDSRVVVIDKPNAGYGNSVNRGLDVAQGEWISIIEPDDLIDKRMYWDLVSLSKSPTGELADIVKSSYWLYFDLKDEEDGVHTKPYVERPNLMNCMPQGFCDLDVRKDPEVLRHHPSIWSAIYRRDFIEDNSIRMIEPPGAGWADNPWFFETMLQAKRIVWTPAAYYYYRQTNPNASSKLKDYHMPFERLRDIRAIYSKFDIENEELLSALYLRSFNYINNSILEEFGFPESDPELQGLIGEVLDSMDEEVLKGKKSRLAPSRISYYNDFMGQRLAKVKKMKKRENPLVSYIVAMCEDRKGLWETLNSFLRQDYENFEVLLVDCGSSDRSFEIARGVADRDGRFRAIEGCKSIVEGYEAGLAQARGQYVHFLRPGVALENRHMLNKLASGLDELGKECDVVFPRTWFPASRILPRDFEGNTIDFLVEGIEADALFGNFPSVYLRMFSRSFVENSGVRFAGKRDVDGIGFSVDAAARAKTAAFVSCDDMRLASRGAIDRSQMQEESDMIERALNNYRAIAQAAEHVGTDTAWRVARCAIVCHLAIDIGRLGRSHTGEKYFEALKDVFMNKYGIREAPFIEYANYLDFAVCDEAFRYSYEEYANVLLAKLQQGLIDVSWQRDAANGRLYRVEHSGSYVLGQRFADTAKAVLPRKLINRFIDSYDFGDTKEDGEDGEGSKGEKRRRERVRS